jgi:hypothetical protein
VHYPVLTLSVWRFKCHTSAVAGALFNISSHHRPMCSLFDEKGTFNGTALSHPSFKVVDMNNTIFV